MFVEQSSHFPTLVSPRVTVMQGSVEVTDDDDLLMTTVLGSCIAACLFDPLAKVGGMNHFLLAEPERRESGAMPTIDEHFGLFLMELLINKMMQAGATKSRMRAHIYGGANIHKQMRAIGSVNAAFAERFLNAERIQISHRDVGGNCARRVDFLAAQGKARCRHVVQSAAPPPMPIRKRPESTGDVEFF
jgi:chemotaxis protein CheD